MSSLNFIGHSFFELESQNKNVDGQTGVRHINLIETKKNPLKSEEIINFYLIFLHIVVLL